MAQQETNCIFCKIIRNEEPGEKIYEDDDVTCIKDINPASTHHYLILPNRHIRNAKTLKPDDSELFDKIVATVNIISEKMELNPASTRTGFHWPPFNTVNHLHLHVISPVENMNLMRKMMFHPNTYYFVSTMSNLVWKVANDVVLSQKSKVSSTFLTAIEKLYNNFQIDRTNVVRD